MSMVDFKNVRQHDVKWVLNRTEDLSHIDMMNNNFLCIFWKILSLRCLFMDGILRWLLSVIRFGVLFFKTLGRFILEPRFFSEKMEVQFWLKKVPPFLRKQSCSLCAVKRTSLFDKNNGNPFLPKNRYFFIRIKNGNLFYIQKNFHFFCIKKTGNLFYILRMFRFFTLTKRESFLTRKIGLHFLSKNIPDFFQPQKWFPFRLFTTCSVQCVVLNHVGVGGRPVRNASLRTIAYYLGKKCIIDIRKENKQLRVMW